MQRQSLGSPNSKLQIHEAEEISVAGGPKRRDSIDDNDCKDSKSRRLSFSPASSSFSASSFESPPKLEKLIHLIPLLTLLCFLVLYLTSYIPSQSDLAYFNGFKHPSKLLADSSEISDAGQLTEFQKGDIWAIRSLRNLHELTKHAPTTRPHRKIAHF